MNDSAWDRLTDVIDVKFGISDHGRRREPLEDKPELSREVRYVAFQKDGQDYRLERASGPAVVERKSIFHKAAGSGVRFENIYDPEEITHKVTLMQKTATGEWEPVELDSLSL